MTDEQYEGWKNRETWGLHVNWTSDHGWYNEVLSFAESVVTEQISDTGKPDAWHLGAAVIEYVEEQLEEQIIGSKGAGAEQALSFYKDVGSWWRVDVAETGADVIDALKNENRMPESNDEDAEVK